MTFQRDKQQIATTDDDNNQILVSSKNENQSHSQLHEEMKNEDENSQENSNFETIEQDFSNEKLDTSQSSRDTFSHSFDSLYNYASISSVCISLMIRIRLTSF